MEMRINYLLLLIIIIMGVAIGNILSRWFIDTYYDQQQDIQILNQTETMPKINNEPKESRTVIKTEPEESTGTRETIKLSPKEQVTSEAHQKPVSTKEQIEQRKVDETGVRLEKKCSEWTVVHKDMNTPSSERGMNKHCSEYYDYISFGALPDQN